MTLRKRHGGEETQHRDDTYEDLHEPLLGDDEDVMDGLLADSRRDEDQLDRPRRASAVGASNSSPWAMNFSKVAWDVVYAVMDVLPQATVPKSDPLSPHDKTKLGHLQSQAETAYSHEVEEHRNRVIQLWYTFTDKPHNEEDFNLKSPLWKDFGFQNVDPGTDFRGAGLLSLKNLLYFATEHAEEFKRISRSATYPFAIAGINITMLLLHTLKLTNTANCFTTATKHNHSSRKARVGLARLLLDDHRHNHRHVTPAEGHHELEVRFGELYVVVFCMVDKEWNKGSKNLLEFNNVLMSTRKQVIEILRVSDTMSEFIYHATKD